MPWCLINDGHPPYLTFVQEHKCVLDTCRNLEDEGLEVTYLPVQGNGLVDINQFKEALRPDTLCASIHFVHNEIGVIQDLKTIGQICKENKVFLHTDAAQAVGKIPFNVKDMNIDLMSISGHKVNGRYIGLFLTNSSLYFQIYGPKGVGALYKRPKVKILRKWWVELAFEWE